MSLHFHPLRVRSVQPDTDEAVIVSFDVPDEVADEFRFTHGQHLTVRRELEDGSIVVIPSGAEHNVVNTSDTEPLRLYTLYSPPEHADGTVQHTKAADESE